MNKSIKKIALSAFLVFGDLTYAMEQSPKDKTNFDILSYTCLMDEARQKTGNEREQALDGLILALQQHEASLEAQKAEIIKMRIACQDALKEGVEDEMYQGVVKK